MLFYCFCYFIVLPLYSFCIFSSISFLILSKYSVTYVLHRSFFIYVRKMSIFFIFLSCAPFDRVFVSPPEKVHRVSTDAETSMYFVLLNVFDQFFKTFQISLYFSTWYYKMIKLIFLNFKIINLCLIEMLLFFRDTWILRLLR